MNDGQNLPSRNDIIEAFAIIDRLQSESEELIKRFPILERERSLVNDLAMRVSGADVAALKTTDIFKHQWAIMENSIFPVMYKDIRNKATFDECMEGIQTKNSPTPAKFVRAAAKLIAALKNMLKV
jgi:hypothetical protein